MRDPARIEPVLDAIRRIWAENPDLRLTQLLVNLIRPSQPCPQVFYFEDSDLRQRLADYPKRPPVPHAANEVTFELTADEAVVLFEFLSRFSDRDRLAVEHPAESQVLYNLQCLLEKQMTEHLSRTWPIRLADARAAVRPEE